MDSGVGGFPEEDAAQPESDPDSSHQEYLTSTGSDEDDDSDEDYEPPSSFLCKLTSKTLSGKRLSTSSTGQQEGPPSRRFLASLPEPSLSSSSEDDDSSPQFKQKGQRPYKSSLKRFQGTSSASAAEEAERWRNREEMDVKPIPFRFKPARTPGPQLDRQTTWTPLTLFQRFFSNSSIQTLTDNTNAYATMILQPGKGFVWKPLTLSEFYVFMAIGIFSGLVAVPQRSDYWRRKWPHDFPFPSDCMSRERFVAIMRLLHFSHPDDDDKNEQKKGTAEYDGLLKIKPLYTEIVNSCKAHFHPYQNLSINERPVVSKPRINRKQYMKKRPTMWGYKLFVLADSQTGYTWNLFICTNKSKSSHGVGYSAVMDLMSLSTLGSGYTLFVESASTALFKDLYLSNVGCCGTLKLNDSGVPQTDLNDLAKYAERGDIRWIRRDDLLFVKWMDRHEMVMCSTVHEAFTGKVVQRKVKQGDVWQTKEVPAPDAVVEYKKHMRVDLSDALIGYNGTHHNRRELNTFFYYFMDIAVVNSFLLHKELTKIGQGCGMTQPHTQKAFREELAAEMRKFADGLAPPPLRPQPPVTCMPVYHGLDATQSRRCCKKCHDNGKPKGTRQQGRRNHAQNRNHQEMIQSNTIAMPLMVLVPHWPTGLI